MAKLDLENFKIHESEQFAFYRIPKLLFTDPFKNVSTDAKLLYGLFLDRMSLSQKNNWADEHGNVYIIFTVDEMMSVLNMSKPTISNLQKELDEIGLIERKRQGQGKPSLIYIKNFASLSQNFLKLKNFTSKGKEGEPLEIKKFYPNDINDNNTGFNNNDDKTINDISDVLDPAEIDLKITSYDNVKNIKYSLEQRGLSISRYYTLHPFVKKLYFDQFFTEDECEIVDSLLKEMNSKHELADIAKAFSYSLSKMKAQKKVKNKLAYFLTILPSNLNIVIENKSKEPFDIQMIYEILETKYSNA